MRNESSGDRFFQIFVNTLITIILIIIIYPLVFVISASFSDPLYLLQGKVSLLPKGFTLESYSKIINFNDVWMGYKNTIIYVTVGTLINLIMTTLGAYPLSRKDFFGRNIITALLVFTMFFSGGMIPTYLVVKSLGLTNTMWAMVLPSAISVYNLIIMRTFFQSIPYELQESATIDGASDFQILARIVLPLSKPILAVMTLFYAVTHWNAFFDALIYLTNRNKYPLQLILREILIQDDVAGAEGLDDDAIQQAMSVEGMKYAVIIIANLPILCLYPFLQRYFVQGVMIGSLKG